MNRALFSRIRRFPAMALLVLVAAASSPALAQTGGGVALLNQAFEVSKTAQNLEQYDQVISLCEEAQKDSLPEASGRYAKSLMSWGLNRRGEALAAQSVELMTSGKTQEAQAADDRALADFQEAIRLEPTRWRAVHNRGISLALRGRTEEALADFARTIELKPEYPNVWFNRAELRYERGQFEEALSDYSQAARLDASDPGTFTSRGHTYYQLARYREALADYSRAVALDPQNAERLVDRADAYAHLGYWEQAALDYRGAIRLNDRLGRAYQGAAWLMSTCPEEKYRDAELALQAAQRAIELDGDGDYHYLDAQAAALANAGQYEEAQSALAKALKLAPPEDAQLLRGRLELYSAGKPYRVPSTSATPQ